MIHKTRGFSSLLALLVIAALVVGGFVIYLAKTNQESGEIVSKDGWSNYEAGVGKWENFSFSYPSTWTLNERKVAPSIDVRVSGDGYNVRFSDIGKGLPTGPATTVTTETISEYKVTFYREPRVPGYTATVSVCSDLGGSIESRTDSREVTDKIIASLKCQVQE